MRIAINGFGRIGRSVFRILENVEGIDVVVINDLFDYDALRYLLNYDTVMGPFQETVELQGDILVTPTQKTKMTEIPNPAELQWGEMGVDFVVEATGRFRKRAEIAQHIAQLQQRLGRTVQNRLSHARAQLDGLCRSSVFRSVSTSIPTAGKENSSPSLRRIRACAVRG